MVGLLGGLGREHKLESWSSIVMDSSPEVKPFGKKVVRGI